MHLTSRSLGQSKPQQSHSFGGEYLELIPNQLIRYTDKFEAPNLPGNMSVTVTMKEVLCGTDLSVTQAGIPDVIPVEMVISA